MFLGYFRVLSWVIGGICGFWAFWVVFGWFWAILGFRGVFELMAWVFWSVWAGVFVGV